MARLIELIHNEIGKPEKQSKKKRSPAFRPSYLGSPCLRKVYYSYLRVPEDFGASVDLKKYGIAGNAAHERISEYLRNQGVLIDYYNEKGKPVKRFGKTDLEFPLKDKDLEVSAKIDAVMNIENKLWLGEWKTISKFPFSKLTMPKPDHLIQGAMYVFLFNKALEDGVYSHIRELEGFTKVEGIRFVYECRDNFQYKEFAISQLDEVFASTIQKMFFIKDCIRKKTLPPTFNDFCKTCSWRLKCQSNSLL